MSRGFRISCTNSSMFAVSWTSRAYADAVGGGFGIVVILASQAAGDLRLTYPAIAEKHQLHISQYFAALGEVGEMCTQAFEAVVVRVSRQHFRGHAGQ